MSATQKPTLYCQMGFIEKFLASLTERLDVLLLSDDGTADVYSACFRLLFGPSNLVFNTESATLMAHPNPMVKKIWKGPAASFQFRPDFDDQIKADDFWQTTFSEVFLLDVSNQEANELERNWGMLVLTPHNLPTKGKRLLPDPPLFIKRSKNTFSWNRLSNQKHCFHSLYIADNYIRGNFNEIRNNLLPLIQTILSAAPLKRKLHITLITLSDEVALIHKNFTDQLAQKGINCALFVVKTESERNHDRHLITNQRWIFSGYGFNLLRYSHHQHAQEVIRDTTLHCLPVCSGGSVKMPTHDEDFPETTTYFGAVASVLEQLKTIADNRPEFIGTQRWTAGEKNPQLPSDKL